MPKQRRIPDRLKSQPGFLIAEADTQDPHDGRLDRRWLRYPIVYTPRIDPPSAPWTRESVFTAYERIASFAGRRSMKSSFPTADHAPLLDAVALWAGRTLLDNLSTLESPPDTWPRLVSLADRVLRRLDLAVKLLGTPTEGNAKALDQAVFVGLIVAEEELGPLIERAVSAVQGGQDVGPLRQAVEAAVRAGARTAEDLRSRLRKGVRLPQGTLTLHHHEFKKSTYQWRLETADGEPPRNGTVSSKTLSNLLSESKKRIL